MAAEQINDIVSKISAKCESADLSGFPEKFAVQFNIKGKVNGVFYVEVLDGKLSVMPYEYNDRDLLITVSKTNLEKIMSGKLGAEAAFGAGQLAVEGDLGKVEFLKKFF